jgi:hypothetical protein
MGDAGVAATKTNPAVCVRTLIAASGATPISIRSKIAGWKNRQNKL